MIGLAPLLLGEDTEQDNVEGDVDVDVDGDVDVRKGLVFFV